MTTQANQKQKVRKQQQWQAHVIALKKSGQSRAEYCRKHQLSYHTLTYWLEKLKRPAGNETALVPVALSSNLRINSVPSARYSLKVILPNAVAVEVSDDFSASTLSRLLATLERR
jgi:lambda repressor-like predicted transcriptional regulator